MALTRNQQVDLPKVKDVQYLSSLQETNFPVKEQ